MPGHWLTFSLIENRRTAIERWWWPQITERHDLSFTAAANHFRELFIQNVRLHLRSDVPLGAALSGGVDSSAVVCAMRHLEPDAPIHTFTFIAPGSDVDEEHWADIVNDRVGAIAHKVVINPGELADDLDEMIRAQGEPFGSTSIYAQYRLLQLARECGITVMLEGQGADELLAGYNGYPQSYLSSLSERGNYLAMLRFLHAWSRWPGRGGVKALQVLGATYVPERLVPLAYHLIGRSPKPAWLKTGVLAEEHVAMVPEDIRGSGNAVGRRLVETLRNVSCGHGLAALLRHGDRNSMKWSLESRVLFLTTDTAEFLLTLPESYLLSPQGETKRLLRAALRGIVPDQILDRRDKIGFRTPERNWLAEQGTRVHRWLDNADDIPFLDAGKCRKEVAAILDGRRRFGSSAWQLINYCRWVEIQGIKF